MVPSHPLMCTYTLMSWHTNLWKIGLKIYTKTFSWCARDWPLRLQLALNSKPTWIIHTNTIVQFSNISEILKVLKLIQQPIDCINQSSLMWTQTVYRQFSWTGSLSILDLSLMVSNYNKNLQSNDYKMVVLLTPFC